MALHGFLFPSQWLQWGDLWQEVVGKSETALLLSQWRGGRRCTGIVTWAVTQMACVNLSKILADRSAEGCRHPTALCGPC